MIWYTGKSILNLWHPFQEPQPAAVCMFSSFNRKSPYITPRNSTNVDLVEHTSFPCSTSRVECWPHPFSTSLPSGWSMLLCSGSSMYRKFLKPLSISTLPSCRSLAMSAVPGSHSARSLPLSPAVHEILNGEHRSSSHTHVWHIYQCHISPVCRMTSSWRVWQPTSAHFHFRTNLPTFWMWYKVHKAVTAPPPPHMGYKLSVRNFWHHQSLKQHNRKCRQLPLHWTTVQRSNEPLNYCTAIKWTTKLLYSDQMNHQTTLQQSNEPLNYCTAIKWTTEQQMNHWTTVQQSNEPLNYCTAIKWTTELLYRNKMNH